MSGIQSFERDSGNPGQVVRGGDSMTYIRWFDEVCAADVGLVGGKAANLGEMVAAGLPVPPGFCLCAQAYRDFIRAARLDEPIRGILAETHQDDPADVEVNSARIRGLVTEQPVPPDIAGQLEDSYHRLAEELGKSDVSDVPVAVRSSATAEDLPTASFAGQQDSYLNVCGTGELIECVRNCWASLWTARAVTYRARQGFDHQKVYLAVVVQAMIDSKVSGVMFTANPMTSSREEAVINASWGLGEAIVSGLVTPDTFTVRKSDGQVLSRQIASKQLLIEYAKEGGTVERETPPEKREIPSLSDDQLAELAALGQRVENHYRTPQDIEWAYAQGRLYILQSRPITTVAPAAVEAAAPTEYNRTMFIELFPDPLTPIFLSAIQPMLAGMLAFFFEPLSLKPPEGTEAVGVFYNQVYFNRDYIAAALDPLPQWVREQMVAQVVNPFTRHEEGPRGRFNLAYLRVAAQFIRFMVTFPNRLPRVVAHYQAQVAEVAAQPVDTISDEEIINHINHLVFGTASRLLNYDFIMIALCNRAYQMLGKLLEPYFEESTQELRIKLISGVTGNATMNTNKALWDLGQKAKASPVVSEMLRRYDESEVIAHLQETLEGRAFLNELEQFLGEYGHREIRMDILYPTWGEDPAPVLSFVRGYLDTDEAQSPHRQQERLVKERQELMEAVRSRLAQDLRGRFLIWPIFRWALKQTQIHTRERDTMHFELTRMFPPFRRLLLELGRRWSERGLIAERDDVFFLGLDELPDLARSPRPLHGVIEERRTEFESNIGRAWPDIIRGEEELLAEGRETASVSEGQLSGLGASPGVATGTARVIRNPEEFGKLKNGDILVAPFTNPIWTPLFAIAGGVVTEVGGMLSHGAIVAREYGIPAVMGIPGATDLLPEGEMIAVDGNKGIVHLQMGEAA
jgi:phosphohistidine swiveling domain-containing protein